MEGNEYVKIGKKGSMIGLRLRHGWFSDIILVCDEGKDHRESFEILCKILADIFPDNELKKITVNKERVSNILSLKVEVKPALIDSQKCAIFEIEGFIRLVERKPSAGLKLDEWVQEIKPIIYH